MASASCLAGVALRMHNQAAVSMEERVPAQTPPSRWRGALEREGVSQLPLRRRGRSEEGCLRGRSGRSCLRLPG